MASIAATTFTPPKDIFAGLINFVNGYKNGGAGKRPETSPVVPPTIDDPKFGVSSKDFVISDNPSISARLYLPKSIQNQKVPILVYFHGGVFVVESAFSQLYHNHFNVFVSQANVLVVSVEYRLAPENPLPAAYEDSWAALKWVANHSLKCPADTTEPWLINHGDFDKIYLGGDSAGANIAHNLALRSGAEALPGDVKLFGAFLSHPYFWGSKAIGSEAIEGHKESWAALLWNFAYPDAADGIDNPLINPLAPGAPSLAGIGCSKILVCIAGKDILRERGVWYYEAVKKSGWKGEVELHEVEDEDHVFHIFNSESENGLKMIKRLASFLSE